MVLCIRLVFAKQVISAVFPSEFLSTLHTPIYFNSLSSKLDHSYVQTFWKIVLYTTNHKKGRGRGALILPVEINVSKELCKESTIVHYF